MPRCRQLLNFAAPLFVIMASWGSARAETTPPDPSSAQPVLPQPVSSGMSLSSPILGGGTEAGTKRPLIVRRTGGRAHHAARHHRHVASAYGDNLTRPALAGVQLLAPIPHPIQPPHFTVPVPAYPFENFITYFTTPAPPVVCHRVARDADVPDPHLLYEKTVVCDADNP